MAGKRKASSRPTRLSPLQRQVLEEFFARESGFFLTGGAALAGYHLGHRETDDLDLFTGSAAAFERGPHALAEAVSALGAALVTRQEAPGFHRYFVGRGEEGVVVDLVLDRVPQIHVRKWERDGVQVDPPGEILVNKLTTLASRCEVRDLVDVMMLERAGHRVEDGLAGALAKDGGCTPAVLAWVLSEVRISEEARLPGAVSPAELRTYLDQLVRRLRRAAAPPSGNAG
jgi:hypothetical protein